MNESRKLSYIREDEWDHTRRLLSEMFIHRCVEQATEEQLKVMIDEALDNWDEERFMELTERLKKVQRGEITYERAEL